MALEKIIIVTRKTRLQELIERFNTKAQARFYIEHAGGSFSDYELEDDEYRRSFDQLNRSLDVGLKLQVIDRDFLPTFMFMPQDIIVTLGQDGLVANAAKYVKGQPIIAVNPSPRIFDGVLLPFLTAGAVGAVDRLLHEKATLRDVTMAEAKLSDGQQLLAFNDLFIGPKTHVSARYRIAWGGKSEPQSSSGVLVSTGAGSTGWLSSIFNMTRGVATLANMTRGVATLAGKTLGSTAHMEWEDLRLVFVVREPFASKHSQAQIVAGMIAPGEELVLESLMPAGGVIFSDGTEADFLQFNSGVTAVVKASDQKAHLVMEKAA
ncbi:MAG TPA: NAD+ kinase [Candidatus Angelobacter sp.]|nr:NAD+ kinase [Candidatus Angelobacter sp.]